MEWMLLPLKRYADFSGRSRRKEFWMFFLFQMLVQVGFLFLLIGLFAVGIADTNSNSGSGIISFAIIFGIYAIFWLAMFVPNMAVVVRRLHDQDIPGIVGILLYLGTIIFTIPGLAILIFMCLEGKKGENQYGEDPKLKDNIGDVFR